MNTKNKILVAVMATTLSFTMGVNAEEVANKTAENNVSAVETKEFAFTASPEVKEKTDSTVTLTWEELPDALGYVVSYGEISVEKSNGEFEVYEKEAPDLIEGNEHTIEALVSGKTYYFAVTAIDKNAQETKFSPELEVVMDGEAPVKEEASIEENVEETKEEVKATEEIKTNNAWALEISNIKTIFNNQMEITFNKYLDNSEAAVREFKVSDKNTGEEIAVEDSRLTNNDMTVIVDLAGELKTDSEYNLTVIALNAKDGSNIEAGVEGTRSFVTPLELFTRVETDEPEAPKDEVVEPEVELNAAPAQAKNLPQTGAQEVIVLFLAMALAGLIFVRRKA